MVLLHLGPKLGSIRPRSQDRRCNSLGLSYEVYSDSVCPILGLSALIITIKNICRFSYRYYCEFSDHKLCMNRSTKSFQGRLGRIS